MDAELFDLLAPIVASLGLELVDAGVRSGLVRVVVDRTGGVDLDAIAEATRTISSFLDVHDPQPGRRYTLEVSSPGLERPLGSPQQFSRALGEAVTVRTVSGSEGERRVRGRLASADDEGFVLDGEGLPTGGRRFSYSEVERARTVFEWPSPSSSRGGRGRSRVGRAGTAALPSRGTGTGEVSVR